MFTSFRCGCTYPAPSQKIRQNFPNFKICHVKTFQKKHVHRDSNKFAKNEHQIELGEFLIEWLSDSPDIKLQTSGSTVKPTEIVAQKSMLAASAMTTINTLGLLPTQKALLCLPMRYIAGKMMLIRALLAGHGAAPSRPSRAGSHVDGGLDHLLRPLDVGGDRRVLPVAEVARVVGRAEEAGRDAAPLGRGEEGDIGRPEGELAHMRPLYHRSKASTVSEVSEV